MTVNERLYATGLIGEWDRAAMSCDRAGMIAILGRVAIREADATALNDGMAATGVIPPEPRRFPIRPPRLLWFGMTALSRNEMKLGETWPQN